MYCSYCHTKLFDSDRCCPACGAPSKNWIPLIVENKPIEKIDELEINMDVPEHILQLQKEIKNILGMKHILKHVDFIEYCKRLGLQEKKDLLDDYLYTNKYSNKKIWSW